MDFKKMQLEEHILGLLKQKVVQKSIVRGKDKNADEKDELEDF